MLIMADHKDQVNMNNAMLSASTFSVKEDSFIDDKVCISETDITVDSAELQTPIWHCKIKHEPIDLDDIKKELTTIQGTDIENCNDVKVDGFSADNIKIEFDNGLLYCEKCEAYYDDYCIECGMLVHILNKDASNNADKRGRDDIPNNILEIQDCLGQTGIYALKIIPAGVNIGPFTGLRGTETPWELKGETFILDENNSKYLNWMQHVNPTTNTCYKNLHVIKSDDNIYYQSTRQIQPGEELLVYFSDEYRNSLNNIIRVDFVTATKYTVKNVFACTFCSLGFCSNSYLAKHKTICPGNAGGRFSIEELTQCSFCKIFLDMSEYYEHHLAYCCERNVRKCALPTPSVKQATVPLNRRKRCLRQFYKCEQCNFRTRYKADLKMHTKQHHEVNVCKCGICYRYFKTKESLRRHVENTHIYIGGKDDQEHSTTDNMNTHIEVEQPMSRDQKKIFQCTLCVFRTKRKQYLNSHKKTIHSKEFTFKCDSCKYETNFKGNLKVHKKTKHLLEFTFKCASCKYETNQKSTLEVHRKTKHLKEFTFKCDSCEFRTNTKSYLKQHIKTRHLKKFTFKCDSCKYETNNKNHLKVHRKSKHLKEFTFKCDSCKYKTNKKHNLEVHRKTKHLIDFTFKCDSCKYETNQKNHLEVHTKSKHSKEFTFKCDSCEFRTKNKSYLKRHIKTRH